MMPSTYTPSNLARMGQLLVYRLHHAQWTAEGQWIWCLRALKWFVLFALCSTHPEPLDLRRKLPASLFELAEGRDLLDEAIAWLAAQGLVEPGWQVTLTGEPVGPTVTALWTWLWANTSFEGWSEHA